MPGWKKGGLSGRGADHILCPCFRAHSDREILCESHVPDSKTILMKFDSEHKKKQQQHIFCEGCYTRCEHYRSVQHFKWPDDE
jgi:hypothetical protein